MSSPYRDDADKYSSLREMMRSDRTAMFMSFWKDVYITAVRANSSNPEDAADIAVLRFAERMGCVK